MIEKKVKRTNKDSIDRWFDKDLHLEQRLIFIEDSIHSGVAANLYKQLALLQNKEEPITIIMDCMGGEYIHGMGMYDAIKHFSRTVAPVTFKVYGSAMSMGSMILQAGDTRLLSPNSVVMIHYGYTYTGFDHALTNEKWADYQKRDKEYVENLYLEKIRDKHPRFTKIKIQKMLSFDTILKGQEVIDLGLADGIIGQYEE